jgi:pyruvate dehydrogenase E2 component (dihydrolipoamide acetyltransferase)
VPASGPKGRVTKTDLQSFAKGGAPAAPKAAAAAPAATGMGIPPIPAVDFSQFGEIEEKPLTRIQKLSGPFLHRAWLNVPMVTHHDEADMTDLEDFRQSLKAEAEKKGVRVTALVFIMKALAYSLKAFPKFNSSLAPDGQSLI